MKQDDGYEAVRRAVAMPLKAEIAGLKADLKAISELEVSRHNGNHNDLQLLAAKRIAKEAIGA